MTLYETNTASFSKRVLIAIAVVMPVAFGLNIPLSSMITFIPVWGVIMINAIIISSYMTFTIPKASTLVFSWINTKKEVKQ